ncbi:MAG: 16S rRNA (cytosine(1402)-N(4))-methyltransferase RsmH [Thermodesulfobacteriota bacterium]
MSYRHIPVMCAEVLSALNCQPGGCIVDCTLGGAGHAGAIVEKILPDGLLIGIDQDRAAIENARQVLHPHASNICLLHDNFVHLPEIVSQLDIVGVDGILVDLGLSLYQIESSGRGFSFAADEPLDMRMDEDGPTTAAEIVNTADAGRLETIFRQYGEERWARKIARRIVEARRQAPVDTTGRLVELIREAVPKASAARQKIHPATRVFMALRIAVNRELEVLETFMNEAVGLLNPGGRLCVIAFHSLEDRIVKHRLKDLEKGCKCPKDFPSCVCGQSPQIRLLTRKPQRPGPDEIRQNPMARSAVLRAAEKLPATG